MRRHGSVAAVGSWIRAKPHGGVSSTAGSNDRESPQVCGTPFSRASRKARPRSRREIARPIRGAAWPSVKFQARCEAFDGSADLYSNYRHLCGYTHAGVPLASWLVFDSTDPRQFFTVQLVGRIALLALGWSSRAFDDLVAESPRSNFLDSVEQRSQLPTRLRIKDTVQVVT
jgi:hypothetical protein